MSLVMFFYIPVIQQSVRKGLDGMHLRMILYKNTANNVVDEGKNIYFFNDDSVVSLYIT